MLDSARIRAFRTIVWKHYKEHGRHELPWRKTRDPYRILVSEIMLQQTQVERVIPYYKVFLKKFPSVRALARAPLSAVLIGWQGLGYNRRAKMLHMAGKAIVNQRRFPDTPEALEALPGIGPYTARAVCAFAYNQDVVFIETNIRTVILHHFFPRRNPSIYGGVSDEEIARVLKDVFPKGRSREWYSALMDYGAHLKRSGVRLHAKAKGYVKQSTFMGSARQARGAILKELAKGNATKRRLLGLFGDDRIDQLTIQLGVLLKEEMVEKKGTRYRLPL